MASPSEMSLKSKKEYLAKMRLRLSQPICFADCSRLELPSAVASGYAASSLRLWVASASHRGVAFEPHTSCRHFFQ